MNFFKHYSKKHFLRKIEGANYRMSEFELLDGNITLPKRVQCSGNAIIEDFELLPFPNKTADSRAIKFDIELERVDEPLLCRKIRQEATRTTMSNPNSEKI